MRIRVGFALVLVGLPPISAQVLAGQGAEWISAAEKKGAFDATSFVSVVTNVQRVVRAEWRVSGLGVFQAFVNGREVGDFLKPGFTHVRKCRHVYSYDVTGWMKTAAGESNVLSATVTSGWWRDGVVENANMDWLPFEDERGMSSAFLGRHSSGIENYVSPDADNAFWGELTLSYADGTKKTLRTDPSWRAARTGAVVDASIYGGETYDARVDEGWRLTGSVDWPQAKCDTQFAGELRPAAAKVGLREDLAFAPKEMYVVRGAMGANEESFGVARIVRFCEDGEPVRLKPGDELVVDFGQNAAAVCSFEVEGAAGTVMRVRHAEMLNEGGGLRSRGNDGPEGTPYVANLRGIRAAVEYTLKDGRQSYCPSYTFFGFRYIGVTVSSPMRLLRVRSIPVTSVSKDMETGSIMTGNPDVNRLVSNIRWGMYSNYLSVPTDCPQRNERVGWSGDTLAFLGAALYNADVDGFLSKWMEDMCDSQFPDGAFRSAAPVGQCGRCKGMSGWADAGVTVPYRLWKRYGDVEVVRKNWQSMVRYLGCLEKNGGHLTNRCGDWLSYEKNDEPVKRLLADCLYFEDARMMSEMAALLGKFDEAKRFSDLAESVRKAFVARHLDASGEVREELRTQTTLAFALRYGLVAGPAAEATKRRLVENIRAHGDRLQTGFLGTAVLLDVLSDVGENGLAVTLLLQREEPSWLYSVDQGATTVWERWNSYTKERGFGPVAMNSFNHYAYGAVLGWMYSSLAGIREDASAPGMAKFTLAPRPDRRIGSVSAKYRTRHGVIESYWRYETDGVWRWRYVVPEGTVAKVVTPDGCEKTVCGGTYDVSVDAPKAAPLVPIGGLTKAFTSALVLTYVAEGKIDLDAPVSRYLGDKRLCMTLRQALSCTAGFRKGHPRYPANEVSVSEALERMRRDLPSILVAEPGTAFVYSPWGYYLAAAVVEKIAGKPYAEALSERILVPLDLADTVFVPSAARSARLADRSRYAWLGVPKSGEGVAAPDCGLFSTEADLGKFARALLSDARMADLFRKQTGKDVDRSFSFGFNLLPDGRIALESSTGCSMSFDRKQNSCAVRIEEVR